MTLMVEISQKTLETIAVKFLALPGIRCIVFLIKGVYLLYGYCRKLEIMALEIVIECFKNSPYMLYRFFRIVAGCGAVMQIVLKYFRQLWS